MPRGRKNKPEIDICRVSTLRLRDLTAKQLERAQLRVGNLFDIPKKKQGEQHPRWLLSSFLSNLRELKRPPMDPQTEKRVDEAYRRRYGEEPISHARVIETNIKEADRKERLIWEMQQKRGCKIKPEEAVARDAIRQGGVDQETINRLRGRRKPKIR